MAGATLSIGAAQRRARLAVRHGLAGGSADPNTIARSLVALHATDPATPYLSVAARSPTVKISDVEAVLYERRELVRMLGMRRTVFVVPIEAAPVVQAACTDAVAVVERRRLVTHLEQLAGLDEAWLAEVEASVLASLRARGSATAAELAADEPRLRTGLMMAEGKAYGGVQNITSRVLGELAARGLLARGRPRGSWLSTQYVWWPTEGWLGGPLPRLEPALARAELARAWLARFGPATVADLRWWAGWTLGQARAAVEDTDTIPVDLDGQPGIVLADDTAAVEAAPPAAALLPGLDPTVMGWSERAWYLGPHGPALFDRNGNAGPTVWWDGRVIGGWTQQGDGRVVVRLLIDVGAEATAAVDAAAARTEAWLDGTLVKARFRTPLERELSG